MLAGRHRAEVDAARGEGVDDGGELDDLGPRPEWDEQPHDSKTSSKWRIIVTPLW